MRLSVVNDESDEVAALGKSLRTEISYKSGSVVPRGTKHLDKRKVKAAYMEVYDDIPDWLAEIESYFR